MGPERGQNDGPVKDIKYIYDNSSRNLFFLLFLPSRTMKTPENPGKFFKGAV